MQKAIKSGRLVDCVVMVNGKPKIDPDTVAVEWDRNTDRVRSEVHGVTIAAKVEEARAARPQPITVVPAAPKPEPKEKRSSKYADSREAQMHYDAELSRLKFEKEVGKLVDAEEVKASAFKAGRRVRDALLNIPDRLAAQIAGESDEHKIYQLLQAEIAAALKELAGA